MTWEKCRDFGVVKINPNNQAIHLHYDAHQSQKIVAKFHQCVVESAQWQGNNLMVRYRLNDGVRHYMYTGFDNSQQIL